MPSRINRSQRKLKRRSRSRRQNKKQFGGAQQIMNFDFKVIENVVENEIDTPTSDGHMVRTMEKKVISYILICEDINLNETHPTKDITPELLNIIYEKLEEKVEEKAEEINEMVEGGSEFSIIVNQGGGKAYVMNRGADGEIKLTPKLNSLSDLVNKELKLRVKFTSARQVAQVSEEEEYTGPFEVVGDVYVPVEGPQGGGRYKKKTRKSRRSRKSRKSKRSRKSKKKTKRRRY